jgi:hypothetical protein
MFRSTLVRLAEQQVSKQTAPITQAVQPQLKFRFTRTHTNNLPVYLSYTGGARRVPMTELRRIEGDMAQAHNEIQRLVGSHVNVRRGDGKLLVTGNFVSKVKKHLLAMGF